MMSRGAKTGEEVVLIDHERLEQGGRRGGGPRAAITFCIRKHEQSRVDQFGGSPLNWNTSTAARFALRPWGGTRWRGTASHSNSNKVGTQHRNPASTQGTQVLGLRVIMAAGRQFGALEQSLPTVRCTRTKPVDTDNLITAHAPPHRRDNNPNEQTMTTRASGNTRARSRPYRRTRRISKGQATSRT
jgi:hypothetical protein